MAIIPAVPGLRLSVYVQNRAAEEYADDDDEDEMDNPLRETTRYIISEEGKEFALRWDFDHAFPYINEAIVCKISLDGKSVDGIIVEPKSTGTGWTVMLKGVGHKENGTWFQRAFRFADLITSETDKADRKDVAINSMGIVSVRLIRASKDTPCTGSFHRDQEVGVESVPEKALKGQAMSHQVKLGKAVPGHEVLTYSMIYPYGQVPFATFNFKYRSRRDLQILHLIPRSPSPIPLEDRPIESLSMEEMQELLRRQRDRLLRGPQIKNELKRERPTGDGTDNEDDVEIVQTRRRSTKALKISVNANTGIETIDLSGD